MVFGGSDARAELVGDTGWPVDAADVASASDIIEPSLRSPFVTSDAERRALADRYGGSEFAQRGEAR